MFKCQKITLWKSFGLGNFIRHINETGNSMKIMKNRSKVPSGITSKVCGVIDFSWLGMSLPGKPNSHVQICMRSDQLSDILKE